MKCGNETTMFCHKNDQIKFNRILLTYRIQDSDADKVPYIFFWLCLFMQQI